MLVPFVVVVGSIAKLGDHGSLSKGYSYLILIPCAFTMLILLCIYWFGESVSLFSSVVVGIVSIVAYLFSLLTFDRFGRGSFIFLGAG